MANNIYFDLSEELENYLLGQYNTLCDDLKEKFNDLNQESVNLCTKTQYSPIVRVVNEIMMLFNEDIYTVAHQTFEEWLNGSGCFSAASENSQSGEEAFNTAKAFEQKIYDMFETFWSSKPLGDGIQIDTSRPKVKDEDFDELMELYQKINKDIETLFDQIIKRIIEKGEDDPVCNIIIPAIKAITEPIKNAFDVFANKISEAKQVSESLKQTQNINNDEASETATQTSASTSEIAEALKMYDDI